MGEIIHIGEIYPQQILLLRKVHDNHYAWFLEDREKEEQTEISAPNIEEAIRLAKKNWKHNFFKLIPSGFRFTLPERDEHGNNALFYQAVRSLNSMNGIYFDEELGCNCIVHQIPLRIRELYTKFKSKQEL